MKGQSHNVMKGFDISCQLRTYVTRICAWGEVASSGSNPRGTIFFTSPYSSSILLTMACTTTSGRAAAALVQAKKIKKLVASKRRLKQKKKRRYECYYPILTKDPHCLMTVMNTWGFTLPQRARPCASS